LSVASGADQSNIPPEMRYIDDSSIPPELRPALSTDFTLSEGSLGSIISEGEGQEERMGCTGGVLEADVTSATFTANDLKKPARSLILIVVILLVIGGVAAGVGIALSGKDEEESTGIEVTSTPGSSSTDEPLSRCFVPGMDLAIWKNSSSSLERYNALIENVVVEVIPDFEASAEPADNCAPDNLALIWLSSDEGVFPKERVVTRFLLALLYFSLNGDRWKVNTGWLDSSDECDWYGLICNNNNNSNNQVIGLTLSKNGLYPMIPSELGLLSNLSKIGRSVYLCVGEQE
jgi:hypothetical protein